MDQQLLTNALAAQNRIVNGHSKLITRMREDWLVYGQALSAIRDRCKNSTEYGAAIALAGLDKIHSVIRSNALWLALNWEQIQEMLVEHPECRDLHHPNRVRIAFRQYTKGTTTTISTSQQTQTLSTATPTPSDDTPHFSENRRALLSFIMRCSEPMIDALCSQLQCEPDWESDPIARRQEAHRDHH